MTRDLYPASLAARCTPGKPFRPCNGTEGFLFEERWCYGCAKYDTGDYLCEINLRAYVFEVGDSEYPKEWTIDDRGQPCCTAFLAAGTEPPVKPLPGQLELFGEGA